MKPRDKNFALRLQKLKERFGLTYPEMGQLFGVGYRMAEDWTKGRYTPTSSKLASHLITLERLEKETDLNKYLSGIHEKGGRGASENKGIDFYVKENEVLKLDIESLKMQNQTLTTTIDFYAENINRLKSEIDQCKKELAECRRQLQLRAGV